jgi:hypothetical protein
MRLFRWKPPQGSQWCMSQTRSNIMNPHPSHHDQRAAAYAPIIIHDGALDDGLRRGPRHEHGAAPRLARARVHPHRRQQHLQQDKARVIHNHTYAHEITERYAWHMVGYTRNDDSNTCRKTHANATTRHTPSHAPTHEIHRALGRECLKGVVTILAHSSLRRGTPASQPG